MGKLSLLITTIFLLSACSQGHCRRQGDRSTSSLADGNKVFVYKYDGSLQCGKGKAISVEEMAKSLNGMVIFSQVKKSDGLMRPAVCNFSPTGQANVYEISVENLDEAVKLGFQKWLFN